MQHLSGDYLVDPSIILVQIRLPEWLDASKASPETSIDTTCRCGHLDLARQRCAMKTKLTLTKSRERDKLSTASRSNKRQESTKGFAESRWLSAIDFCLWCKLVARCEDLGHNRSILKVRHGSGRGQLNQRKATVHNRFIVQVFVTDQVIANNRIKAIETRKAARDVDLTHLASAVKTSIHTEGME